MTCDSDRLDRSYAECRRLARGSGSSFYRSFSMLGRSKRRAMEVLYAFMRYTDDLGDNSSPVADRKAALARWRMDVTAALAGDLDREPAPGLLPAVADIVRRFYIPRESLLAVLDGVQMDLDNRRYETFEQLTEYCRRVATAVGIACVYIWGFRGCEPFEPVDRCGHALQLTNILRDLREDVRQGRCYLPLEELCLYNYSVADLAAGITDERFLRVMDFQIDRAEQFYREGARLFDCLHADGQRIFGMMITVYHRLLREIRGDPAAVLSRQVSLGWIPKMRITARWLLWPPRYPSLR